jgi:hypothetical protein
MNNIKGENGMVKKKKRTFFRVILWILAGLLVLTMVGVVFVLSVVPLTNLVSALESYTEGGAPQFLLNMEAIKGVTRDYSTLPDILSFNNGDAVETADYYELRKNEMEQLLKDTIYGSVPDVAYEVSFKTLEENEQALDGNAIRKQIEITVTTELGESKAMMLVYLPKMNEPVPVFLGLNFIGNTTIYEDENIIPSFCQYNEEGTLEQTSGERYSRWVADYVIDSGYALATICASDFAPDSRGEYNTRLISIFGGDTETLEFKTISAWAFGMSRAVDYLVQDEAIDSGRIITVGHSRLGKTSLWAAAQDERISLAISSGSGCAGAALARSTIGETVKLINQTFPYWFVDAYSNYAKNEEDLPVDQHMLLASIYPRKVYVASSARDLWADPFNEFMSLKFASEALSEFGVEPITQDALPEAGTTIFSEYYGYHIKEDRHRIKREDWEHFIDYADAYLTDERTPLAQTTTED